MAAAQATSPAQRAAVEKLKQAERAVERAEATIAEVESSQRKHIT